MTTQPQPPSHAPTASSPRPIKFEHHLQLRVMEVHFPEGFRIASQDDLQELKRAWMQALRTWHSPYTLLFDVRDFQVEEPMRAPFEKLVTFFKGFFMKRTVGFTEPGRTPPEGLPFPIHESYEAASKETGLGREGGLKRDLSNLRDRIVFENDFTAHVMEVSFLSETHFASASDIDVLRSKLTNVLMQWHSPYSLVFNCANVSFAEETKPSFERLERFLKGFFCKTILGYSPRADVPRESYPFPTYRARHVAVAKLEHEGLVAGDVANCSTKSSRKKGEPTK